MKRLSSALAVLAVAALSAACSSPVKLEEKSEVPIESRNTMPGGGAGNAAGAGSAGAAQSQVATVSVDRSAVSGAARIVYFDYDSFVVKDEFRALVESNAKRMTASKSLRASIEGHTDERGGREYNLALGQKRAEAVLRAMSLLGVTEAQLEAVSFGKERPAAQGSDEAAWARNRRAELKDK